MACCCVAEMVEINKPTPSVESRNKQAAKNRSGILPLSGMSNQVMAGIITTVSCKSDRMI